MYWDCNPTIYRATTATDRTHYRLTESLPNVNFIWIVTRYSYGIFSFRCCGKNCDAEHRGTRPFDSPTNETDLATLRWEYIYHRLTRRIDAFHHHLNGKNTDIQLTREVEENSKLPFLDCLVTRDDNSPRTSVYRKLTHTDWLLESCFGLTIRRVYRKAPFCPPYLEVRFGQTLTSGTVM